MEASSAMLKKIVLTAFVLFAPFYLQAQEIDSRSSYGTESEGTFDPDFIPAVSPVDVDADGGDTGTAQDEKIIVKKEPPVSRFPSFKSIELSAGYNTASAFESYSFFGNLKFLLDSEKVRIRTGLQYGSGNVDFSNSFVYWPLRFSCVRLGLGLIYNLEFFLDISMTHNLLPGFYLECRPCSWFSFDFMLSFFIKGRTIYALKDDCPLLMNYSAATGFNFNFYLPYNIALFLGMNSCEDFRYMVLGASSFSAGISYVLNDSWSFYFTGTARYVDFFFLSSAFEDAEFKLSARYTF